MQIDVLSLFPAIATAALCESMMKRAQEKGLFTFKSRDLRDWTHDKYRRADDAPYGGGQGMVMKCEPIFEAVESLRTAETRVVFMGPCGRRFDQRIAQEYSGFGAKGGHLIILCGHYEGVDQRVLDHLVDDEISVGDYVLTNGVIAAVVFVDAIVRLIPGVLGDDDSATDDSFATGLLEFPHYTRPPEYRGWKIPDILLSGNHAHIERWRREQALERTRQRRPDLLPPKKKLGCSMPTTVPGEIELYASFSKHLGPRFEAAGLRVQFHYNQTPGIHFRVPVSEEYRDPILRGIQEGMALRFPQFPSTGSIWITEVTEHEVDSSQRAFYRVARSIIEQAHAIATSTA